MTAAARLDVREKLCPMTWLAAKLALERLQPGEVLEVECAPGEALENVPRSARDAGHHVRVQGTTVVITRR